MGPACGGCGSQTQEPESGMFVHNQRLIYLHIVYDRHMNTLRGGDGHPHFVDGQIESQKVEISYPGPTDCKRLTLAS